MLNSDLSVQLIKEGFHIYLDLNIILHIIYIYISMYFTTLYNKYSMNNKIHGNPHTHNNNNPQR